MSALLKLYRESHSYDVNSFKRYLLAKGGETWEFVFNNYISKGMKHLVDAVEVCTELVNAESVTWTWQESLDNLPTPNLDKYHTVLTSQHFIYRWCVAQGIEVWKLAKDLKVYWT